jgi:hypothetical protein
MCVNHCIEKNKNIHPKLSAGECHRAVTRSVPPGKNSAKVLTNFARYLAPTPARARCQL